MLSLVIFILTVSNVWLIHAEVNPVVDEVCKSTPKPNVCHQCLDNALGSDMKGLAYRSINICSLTMRDTVEEDLGIIANGTGDPAVKDTCAKGHQLISDSVANVRDADVFLMNNDYVRAANKMAAAIDRWTDCYNLLRDLPAPPQFFYHLAQLRNLYVNAQAILYQL